MRRVVWVHRVRSVVRGLPAPAAFTALPHLLDPLGLASRGESGCGYFKFTEEGDRLGRD